LFSDGFARLTAPGPLSPWVVQSGNWAVTGGALTAGTNPVQSYGYAYITNSWTNYAVAGQIEFSSSNAWGGGIGGRLNPATGAHYAAWIYPEGSPGGSNVVKLLKFQTWTTFGYEGTSGAAMAKANLAETGTNWHTVELAFYGNQIAVYCDGSQVMSVTDQEAQPYFGGEVSVDTWTSSLAYTMSVSEVIVRPLVVDDSYSGVADTALTVANPGVLGNDTGVYASNLVAVLVSGPTNGTLSLSTNGGFTYSPATNYSGTDHFTYQANQGSNDLGTATVTITVMPLGAPVISQAPLSRTNAAGTTAAFSVGAVGILPLSYQWQFNGANLPGATSANLTLADVQPANAGSYTVVVTNSAGLATSAAAVLTVVPGAGTLLINGGLTYQTIDGFGVNANHRSWTNNELAPVLDALINQARMTLFRVVYDNSDWETNNNNSGPTLTNWSYFSTIYSTWDFQALWGIMAYLNQKGITNGLIPNFQGFGPSWMGGLSLTSGYENNWAEMIASALIYARYTNHLQFTLVEPNNEPDIAGSGIETTQTQYPVTLDDLSQQLNANGMGDVRFIGPDLGNTSTAWLSTMMNDSNVMAKLADFGIHGYLGVSAGSAGVYNFLQQSAYPNLHFWVTEYNVWCQICQTGGQGTNNWDYFRGTAEYLLSQLADGASGGMVWEGYDSVYRNNNNDGLHWSFWGLFAVNDTNAVPKTYTARKNFYTLSQITEFVRPGAQQIDVSGSTSLEYLLAFYNTNNGQITLTGVNTNSSATSLSCALTSLPAIPGLELYYTSSATNLCYGGSVALTNDAFSVVVPADCVFTLTVVCPSVTLGPAALANGTIGLSYSQGLGASGGAAPYSYSVISGSLPPGLALSGGGVLAGTPAAVGNFSFTVQAEDMNGCSGTNAYTLAIGCPAITVGPATLSSGLAGTAYSQSLTASGGLGSYSFAVTGGTLPAGLSLSGGGVLSGMPSGIGTNSFTVTATDTNGCPGSHALTLAVTGAPPAIALQPQSLTNIIGTDASFSVTASGAPPPACQWQFNGAAIPGATGTNLLRSAVSFADAGGYRVVLTNAAGAVTSTVATLTVVCPAVTLTPASLANGTAGLSYSQGLGASGGAAPYSYSVISGSLPPGLALSGGGVLAGTPAAVGNFSFAVQAADTNGCSGTNGYTLAIGCPAITVGPATLSSGLVGTAYSQSLTASGGLGSYSFAVTAGTLPAGLSLSGGGILSGTPSAIGTNSFTVTATDTNGCPGSLAFTLGVTGVPPAITGQPASQQVVAGTNAGFGVTASGTGPLSYQWLFNGTNLSDGGQFSGATNSTLSLSNVQPTNAGSYWVEVTNPAGSVISTAAVLTVVVPPDVTLTPTNQTVPVGGTASFSAVVAGTEPISYQWQWDGTNLDGAVSQTLSLTNVQPGQAGGYSVMVTNSAGSATSAVAVLTVASPPLLLNARTTANGTFTFTLSGVAGLSYVIEVTTNLEEWTPLASVTNIADQADFTDMTSSNSVSRFYRARLSD
jgi:hypothetical protein